MNFLSDFLYQIHLCCTSSILALVISFILALVIPLLLSTNDSLVCISVLGYYFLPLCWYPNSWVFQFDQAMHVYHGLLNVFFLITPTLTEKEWLCICTLILLGMVHFTASISTIYIAFELVKLLEIGET